MDRFFEADTCKNRWENRPKHKTIKITLFLARVLVQLIDIIMLICRGTDAVPAGCYMRPESWPFLEFDGKVLCSHVEETCVLHSTARADCVLFAPYGRGA
jgi:hypothetical protein